MNESTRNRRTVRSRVVRDAMIAHAERCGKDIVAALGALDIRVGLGCIYVTEMVRIGFRPLNGIAFRDVLRLRHDISSRFDDDVRVYANPKGLFAECACSTDRNSAELELAKRSRARPKYSFTPSSVEFSSKDTCPCRYHSVNTMQRFASSFIAKLTAILPEFGIDILPLSVRLCTLLRFVLKPAEGIRATTILRCRNEVDRAMKQQTRTYATPEGVIVETASSALSYDVLPMEGHRPR